MAPRDSVSSVQTDADKTDLKASTGQSSSPSAENKSENKESQNKTTNKKEYHSPWPLIGLGILVVVAAIGGLIYWLMTRNEVSTDDAYTDGRAVMIAPHIGGYVTELAVNDNQFVHKGDLLFALDTRDYLTARDEAAGQAEAITAQLDSAVVALDKARTTYPAQLQESQGQALQSRGKLLQARAEYRREHSVDPDATSQQTIDTANAGLAQAQGAYDQAIAQVEQASLIDQNIAQATAQIKQLQGQLKQAKASLAQAETNLSYARVTAPLDGWITERNIEVGDYLQPGAEVLALVSPDYWVTANFKETQLARMRPGQHVHMTLDAYPDIDLYGHIDSIQRGSGSRFTAFPAENATGNFVKIVQRIPVKIVIDRVEGASSGPPPLGMSVVPTVDLQ